MKLDFQRQIAGNTFTLPVVCAIAIGLWLVLPHGVVPAADYASPEFGLWQLVPVCNKWTGWCVAIVAAALGVYLMAELNNRNALLRISSRMISSVFAMLCAVAVALHQPQPGMVVMLMSQLSLFPVFGSYQQASASRSFCASLCLSVSSLVFPKALVLLPLHWLLLIHLRGFSFRCLAASLIAVAVPYWLCFGAMFDRHTLGAFVQLLHPLADWQWGGYSQLALPDILTLAYILLLFLVGMADFILNSFLDKSHTRALYTATIIHGLYIIIYIALQPHLLNVLLPLFIIDTSILFGHFFALTYTRASHILNIVLLLLGVAVVFVANSQ